MSATLRALGTLCLELAGLALLASAAVLIAAFHRFGGFGHVPAGEALLFSIVSVVTITLGLILHASLRIARLIARNEELQRAATRDGLTRLLNRTAFKSEAERAIASMARRRGDAGRFALLVIDADHFKRINDRLGHHVGDQALVSIAAALAGGLRHDDLVGRLGGEEFAVLLRDAGPAEASIVAERLRQMVNRLAVGPRSSPARLSVSLGGCTFDRPVPFDLVYRQADALLYKAKRSGRNRAEIAGLARLADRAPGPRLGQWTASAAPSRDLRRT